LRELAGAPSFVGRFLDEPQRGCPTTSRHGATILSKS